MADSQAAWLPAVTLQCRRTCVLHDAVVARDTRASAACAPSLIVADGTPTAASTTTACTTAAMTTTACTTAYPLQQLSLLGGRSCQPALATYQYLDRDVNPCAPVTGKLFCLQKLSLPRANSRALEEVEVALTEGGATELTMTKGGGVQTPPSLTMTLGGGAAASDDPPSVSVRATSTPPH